MTSCRLTCLLLLFSTALIGCRSTPITGRRQVLVVPEANEISMGISAYRETLAEETPSKNQQWAALVTRVGNRIAQVANRPDYEWEFQLVASPQMNAFALPGGKVAIYEGILPVCENEAGLAVVMSHEIAHALARHGGERMTHQYLVNGMGWLVDLTASKYAPGSKERVSQAYGLASKYGFTLPYSRKHESEADHMGMMLMAQAGYDPREAPLFWQRFGQAQASGDKPSNSYPRTPPTKRDPSRFGNSFPRHSRCTSRRQSNSGLGEQLGVSLAQRNVNAPSETVDASTQ